MRKRYIPTVTELEAFTACARLGTTTLAAAHLNLTQSAISRALASLEDRLGAALFHRQRQRLVLSQAGHVFQEQAEEVLARLNGAATAIMAFGGRDRVLRLAVLPSFARAWLIPRLPRFARAHPEISLDITARLSPVDFTHDPFDCTIMRSQHEPPGSEALDILPERLLAIAHPDLLAGRAALEDEALLALPLLQQSTRPTLWLDWFHGREIDPRRILRGARFDHFDMVLDAAIAGLGVGLVPEVLAAEALAEGLLRPVSARRFDTGESYRLFHPPGGTEAGPVAAFRAWLAAETRQGPAPSPAPGTP
jgi:LysR family glycine cleavage system transcriptional activator